MKHSKLESQIKKECADYLRMRGWIVLYYRNVGIFNKKSNGFIPIPQAEIGVSDLIGSNQNGRAFAAEIKRPGQKLTPYQTAFLQRVKQKGWLTYIWHSLDECIEQLKQYEYDKKSYDLPPRD